MNQTTSRATTERLAGAVATTPTTWTRLDVEAQLQGSNVMNAQTVTGARTPSQTDSLPSRLLPGGPERPVRPGRSARSKASLAGALAVAVVTASILAACGGAPATAPKAAVPVSASARPVSVEGNVVPLAYAKLSFAAAGRVRTLVASGQPVLKGDVLAQLESADLAAALQAAQDDLAVARVQERLAQEVVEREAPMSEQLSAAAAGVSASRARLADVRNGPRVAERRAAEAAVEQAAARLTDAIAKRDQIAAPPKTADVEAARSTLEKAQRDAEAAQARLAQLERGTTPEEVASAQSAVEHARADLDAARAAVRQLQTPPSPADVAAAQAQLDQANTRLAQLRDAPHVAQQDVANAQLAVEQARVAVDKAMGDRGDSKLVGADRPMTVQAADAAIKQAQLQLNTAQNSYDKVAASAPSEWDVRLAEQAVASAQAARERAIRPATAADLDRAQAQVRAAEATLSGAQAKLAQVQRGSEPAELVAASGTLAAAHAGITAAQARLDQIQAGPANEERRSAEATIEAVAADLRGAQARFDQVLAGPTPGDAAQAESAVAGALSAEAQARRNPSDGNVVAAAARTKRAETAVEQARLAVDNTVLRAPIDGVITSVGVRTGEYVAPGAVAVTIADLAVLKIETKDLDEAAAARVRDGQEVTITVPALDRRTLPAVVLDVSRQPTFNQSGDVFYTATIALTEADPALRWGMTVRVEFK